MSFVDSVAARKIGAVYSTVAVVEICWAACFERMKTCDQEWERLLCKDCSVVVE